MYRAIETILTDHRRPRVTWLSSLLGCFLPPRLATFSLLLTVCCLLSSTSKLPYRYIEHRFGTLPSAFLNFNSIISSSLKNRAGGTVRGPEIRVQVNLSISSLNTTSGNPPPTISRIVQPHLSPFVKFVLLLSTMHATTEGQMKVMSCVLLCRRNVAATGVWCGVAVLSKLCWWGHGQGQDVTLRRTSMR